MSSKGSVEINIKRGHDIVIGFVGCCLLHGYLVCIVYVVLLVAVDSMDAVWLVRY